MAADYGRIIAPGLSGFSFRFNGRVMKIPRIVLATLLALAFPVSSAAAMQWVRAGLYGADVRAMVIDPRNPDRIWLGTSNGEIYRTDDGAASWAPVRESIPFPGYTVDNLLMDSEGRLWAATWGLWGGGAVAFSADGGETWTRRDKGLENVSIRAFAIDPRNPDSMVAGGLNGVWKSSDSGRSWRKISEHVNVESLAIDPRRGDTIYVGTWRQAWRSDDGGANWKHIAEGMVLDTDVFNIHIDPRSPDSVWIATCGWVYNTKNRGDLWTRYRDGFENRRVHDIVTDPTRPDIVYAGSVAGLYRTTDAGKNWSLLSRDNLVINTILVDPRRPDRILLGTEGDGVYVSTDRGKTFNRSSSGLYNLKITSVVPDPSTRGTLYAVVYFGGAASGIWKSADAGRGWERLSEQGLPEVRSLIVRKDGTPRFLAGTERGIWISMDGVQWKSAEPSGYPIRVDRLVAWSEARLFAATSEGVYTSRDGGASWYRLGQLEERTADVALGRFGGQPALYALTSAGVRVFDGRNWVPIEGAPEKGHRLAVRSTEQGELVMVSGFGGVKAGLIGREPRWSPREAVDGRKWSGVVDGTTYERELVVLFDPARREMLVSGGRGGEWTPLNAPVATSQSLMSVARDPFDPSTLYISTAGQGVFIYRAPSSSPAAARAAAAGGSK